MYMVNISSMYIFNVSFEKVLYFLEKGNINIHMALQENNYWEKCKVGGWGGGRGGGTG